MQVSARPKFCSLTLLMSYAIFDCPLGVYSVFISGQCVNNIKFLCSLLEYNTLLIDYRSDT